MSDVIVAPLLGPTRNEPSSAAVIPGSAPSSVERITNVGSSLSVMVTSARSSLGSAIPTPLSGAVMVLKISVATSGPSAAPSSTMMRA